MNDVDRQSKSGDQLNIDFEGKIAGQIFEGGSAKGKDLVLGSNTMIAGFESGLRALNRRVNRFIFNFSRRLSF